LIVRRFGETLVQLPKAAERQIDLAADLDHGRRVALEPQRNRLDRAQVRRDVLALHAVAARGPAHKKAVLVRQVDRKPVDLRLEYVGDRLAGEEALADVLVPFPQPLLGRHLLERAHRLQVPDLLELVR
jgi:hypothetical protein